MRVRVSRVRHAAIRHQGTPSRQGSPLTLPLRGSSEYHAHRSNRGRESPLIPPEDRAG